MSTLERRLHVLIDEERDHARRAAAARFLLASADTGEGPGESWEEMLGARARDLVTTDDRFVEVPGLRRVHPRDLVSGRT